MHHRGSAWFWIVFAILATIVLGPGMWFVLGRGRNTALAEDAAGRAVVDAGAPSAGAEPEMPPHDPPPDVAPPDGPVS